MQACLQKATVPSKSCVTYKCFFTHFDGIRHNLVGRNAETMSGAKFTAHMRAALQGATEAGLRCICCLPQDKPGIE